MMRIEDIKKSKKYPLSSPPVRFKTYSSERSKSKVESSRQSELILRIAKERCQDSFRQIFDYYSPKVFQYARTYHMDDASAMDLVQEVMAVIWRKSKLFNPEKGQVSTWIFTITRNLRYDLLRKKKKESTTLSSEDIWHEVEHSSAYEIEGELELNELSQEMALKVESLPDPQKEVLHSIYFLGLTHEEYSAQSGIPLGTVKSRLRLALAKLTRLMG